MCLHDYPENERHATDKDKIIAHHVPTQWLCPEYNKNPQNSTEQKETTVYIAGAGLYRPFSSEDTEVGNGLGEVTQHQWSLGTFRSRPR